MSQGRHPTPKSDAEFRKWIRFSVAAATSAAMVGGVLVPAPSAPVMSAMAAAAELTSTNLVNSQIVSADGTVLDLGLLVASGALSSEDAATVLQAVTADQAWPEDAATTGPETASLDIEALSLIYLDIGGVAVPLLKTESNPNGLLDLSTAGVGLLGASAYAPGPVDGAIAGAGAVTTNGGGIEIDTNAFTDPTTKTSINVLSLTDQLGLQGLTDLAVDQLTLDIGAAATVATADATGTNSEYALADVGLNLHSQTLAGLIGVVNETVAGVDGTLNTALNADGVINGVLDILRPVLTMLSLGDTSIAAHLDLAGALQPVLETPIYDGVDEASSLVVIDLRSGNVKVNLENLYADSAQYPNGINGLDPNTPLVGPEQLSAITTAVNTALGNFDAKINEVLSKAVYDTQLTITIGASDGGLLNPLTGELKITTTLGGLLGTPEYESPTIANGGISGSGVVGGLLSLVVGALAPVLGSVGGVLLPEVQSVVDNLTTALLGSDTTNGALSPLMDGLSPLITDVVGRIVQVIINAQDTTSPAGTNTLSVAAAKVAIVSATDTELVALPLAVSTVSAPTDISAYAPTLTGITPDGGPAGQQVTLTGTNLVYADSTTTPETVTSLVTEVTVNGTAVPTTDYTVNPDNTITLTMPDGAVGTTAEITVTTGGGISNALTYAYSETVTDANQYSPSYPDTSVAQGTSATVDPVYFGTSPTGATYALGEGAPAWARIFDETTGTITLLPDARTPVGDTTVPVVVTYPDGSTDTVNARVSITATTQADIYNPNYWHTAVTQGSSATARPIYLGNTPSRASYALGEGAPSWAVISGTTGEITFQPGLDTPVGDTTVPVVVTYSDGSTDTVNAPVTVTASSQKNLYEPSYAASTVGQGATATVSPSYSSYLGDTPSGAIYTLGEGAPTWISVDSSTGEITYSPGLEEPVGNTEVPVVVTYSDRSTDSVTATVTVTAADQATLNSPIYQGSIVTQGVTATVLPTYTGDAPTGATYALGQDAPTWATIAPDTGEITFAPGLADATGDTEVFVVVTYADESTDTVSAPVTVNAAPPLTDGINTEYPSTVSLPQGDKQTLTPVFTDSSAQPIEFPTGTIFTLAAGYPGWISIDPNTGVITASPNTIVPLGDYPIMVTATYADGSTDNSTITITVADGAAPVIAPISGQRTSVGNDIQPIEVVVTDDSSVTVSVEGLPDGVNFDPATSLITGTPAQGTEGDRTVTVTATDAQGHTTVTSFQFNVTSMAWYNTLAYPQTSLPQGTEFTIAAPYNTQAGPERAPAGTTFAATDPAALPSWVTVNADGTITVTPGADLEIGQYSIPVTAAYPDGTTDQIVADVLITQAAVDGATGASAHELWVQQELAINPDLPASELTVEKFLASLIGADGTDGIDGADGKSTYELWLEANPGKNEDEFWASLVGDQGPEGKSAYDVWVEQQIAAGIDPDTNPELVSQDAFFAAITGDTGDTGADGADGADGTSPYITSVKTSQDTTVVYFSDRTTVMSIWYSETTPLTVSNVQVTEDGHVIVEFSNGGSHFAYDAAVGEDGNVLTIAEDGENPAGNYVVTFEDGSRLIVSAYEKTDDDDASLSETESSTSSTTGLERCLASPTGSALGLLALTGVLLAVGAPMMQPILASIGAEINSSAAAFGSPVPGLGDPAWLQEVNSGLARISGSIDPEVLVPVLIGAAAIAALSAEDACAVPGSSD